MIAHLSIPIPPTVAAQDDVCALEIPLLHVDADTPERRLCSAMFIGAIRDAISGRATNRESKLLVQQRARDWIFSNDKEWTFTFLNLCEMFNFNPTKVREWVRKAKPTDLHRLHFHAVVYHRDTSRLKAKKRRIG